MSQSAIREAISILLGSVPEGSVAFVQERVASGVYLAHAVGLWLRQA